MQHQKNVPPGSYRAFTKSLFAGLLLTLFGSAGILPPALAAPPHTIADEVLISVSPENDGPAEAQKLAAYGTILRYQPDLHLYRIRIAPTRAAGNVVTDLKGLPEARYAEQNHTRHVFATPNDTYYSRQYAPKKIQADLAWNFWKPKQQVIIAIVDTGVDSNHPDLTNKILRDSNGVLGYDAIAGRRDTASDVYGHGTFVAGIAAAQTNNGTGVAGIAGWNGQAGNSDAHYIKIMPVRVLGKDGTGADSDIADGVTWAVNHGARVINMSLGDVGYTDVLNNACQYAWNHGCILCAAAGNDGVSDVNYPAGDANVIAVAATDKNDQLTTYSNWGGWVQVAAPGGANVSGDEIYSTMPTYNTNIPGNSYTLNYDYLSGTSMSTPFVAGEAALLMAQNPSLTNAQVYNLILTNVDAYSPVFGETIMSGGGRINVNRALQAAGTGPAVLTPAAGSILFQNAQSGQIAYWYMNGQTVTSGSTVGLTPDANWKLVASADMNGDGQPDLIFQNRLSGQIAVWYMNGSALIGSALLSQTPAANYQVVGVGDFTGSGQPDLVFQNSLTGQIAIWYLSGTTVAGGGLVNASPVSGWNAVGVGDFTGGGRRDLVFQNAQSGQIAFWTISGQTVTAGISLPNVPAANYRVVGLTDLNGDNNPDIVFQNTQTGQVAIWYMNGTRFQGGGLTSLTPLTGWNAVGPK